MRWAGWRLGQLLGLVSACAVYVLLREIWGVCRVGINASARGFSLVFLDMPRTFALSRWLPVWCTRCCAAFR